MDVTAPRRLMRVTAVTTGVSLAFLAAPALAAPPESWQRPDNGPLLGDLLVLVGIPLAIALVLTLLTYLPSMIRGQSDHPELAFQESSEWFGGPRKGLDAATARTDGHEGTSSDRGGASASW